jgi:hypothetical protein
VWAALVNYRKLVNRDKAKKKVILSLERFGEWKYSSTILDRSNGSE